MALPGNGIFVVRGEMSTLMTAMRRGSRWNSSTYGDDEKDGLLKLFLNLKQVLNRIEDLRLIDPNIFLAPFLEVIRTDETTGAVTSLALTAINKFLSYGLIDPTSPNLAVIVENIVDAVTHARFMGTDQSSDGVTLFRVVEVLHTLMRSPEGSALTNEAVCEVMLSCFKICFEPRLNELLRRSAEQALKDMVLLLFMRLPQFSEDRSNTNVLKKFQMMAASMEKNKKQSKKQSKPAQLTTGTTLQRSNSERSDLGKTEERKISISSDPQSPHIAPIAQLKAPPLATTPATPAGNILDMQGKITQTPTTAFGVGEEDNVESGFSANQVSLAQGDSQVPALAVEIASPTVHENVENVQHQQSEDGDAGIGVSGSSEYINSVGVRFTQQNSIDGSDGMVPLLPYGLPCIQELFRFLILLCNPLDKQNTDTMMHMGLSLLTVAFEVGADNIGKYDTLLELVKDDLCRNLMALMNSERLTIFAADLQLCFLLFESLRGHLKFQMEAYLKKLSEIIANDSPKTPYEMRELALDNLLQLWRIPGFVSELYINYDCDLYCSDMFESLVNLLSKYTLTATNAIYSTHIIAVDTLISVIENIEYNCAAAKSVDNTSGSAVPLSSSRHSRHNSELEGIVIDSAISTTTNDDSKIQVENISKFLNSSSRLRLGADSIANASVTREHLANVKQKKRVLTQGTELFNQRPDKGIMYLQENGILSAQLDPMEVAMFLRENPGLDKKMIGEYISKKKNVDSKILMNFVDSFDFSGLRIDEALRLYLETFRLPGEAPLIFLVLEHFADHWHKQNGEPFANTDAAFSLAYATIMLNMDQHNSNAKRLNIPMTQEDFLKNLRGLNGGSDFDQEMLATVFNAIKNEEIVMPAEQTGLVRENYLWKVLLRRGVGSDGVFKYVQDSAYDIEIFNIIWGASLSALSLMFDKSTENGYQRILAGFTKCASIAAHFNQHEDFDALILTLCKFTTLLNTTQQDGASLSQSEIVQAANFGVNAKAQAAIRTVFALVHDYGDCLREGWKQILDLFLQLFRLKLLPKSIIEVEDFCEESGKTQLKLEKRSQKQEAGLFSSLYSYLSSEGQREPSYEEQEFIKIGKKCIKECQLDQMIQESKFVQLESLQELLRSILMLIKAPTTHKFEGAPYAEDVVVFWMELLVKIVIQNRDRMIQLWPDVRDRIYLLLMSATTNGYDYLLNRSTVAILKLAIYLMRNEELCPVVLKSLKMLLALKPPVILRISRQISTGVYELLKTSAQNIHSEQDWQIIFTILECVGAGAVPPEFDNSLLPSTTELGTKSDGTLSSEEDSGLPDRGYISDSEIATKQEQNALHTSNASSPHPSSPTTENWILVNKDTDLSTLSRPQSPPSGTCTAPVLSPLIYNCKLGEHSPIALFKCWDSLAFIVRNVAHITPYNFESCVRCIRTFVECCRDGGINQRRKFEAELANKLKNVQKKKPANKRTERETQRKSTGGEYHSMDGRNSAADEDLWQRYETLSIQLIDLMYTLYTRTAQIFRWWAEEGCAVPQCSALWAQGWCPLLQGIGRLAMDRRREVRTYAISCLQQRALLVHDLQSLSGAEWASCFQLVLFPLLNELLPDSASVLYLDNMLLEESRIRTATIMSKVFLHHLTPLIELGAAFNELWLEILDYIDKFMKVGSDMLSEQMQEILKNMLLVMHSVRVFHNDDGTLQLPLWELTWRRIGEFLPNLKEDLFHDEGSRTQVMSPSATIPITKDNQLSANVSSTAPLTVPLKDQELGNQQEVNEHVASSPRMAASPTDILIHHAKLQSPNSSIVANSILLQEASVSQNVPLLVAQMPQSQYQQSVQTQQHQQSLEATLPVVYNQKNPLTPLYPVRETPAFVSPLAAANFTNVASQSDQKIGEGLLNLINDSSELSHLHAFCVKSDVIENVHVQEQTQKYREQQQLFVKEQPQQLPLYMPTHLNNAGANNANNYAFSIELPETSPAMQLYAGAHQQVEQQHQLQKLESLTEPEKVQEDYSESFTPYQAMNHMPVISKQSTAEAISPSFSTELTEAKREDNVNVPMNSLLAGNQYLDLHNNQNPAIVCSFAPLSMQSQLVSTQSDADIYQEYMSNPYNLTLQHEAGALPPTTPDQTQLQQQHQGQSSHYAASYFNANVDPSSIPPGSEMLYGQP